MFCQRNQEKYARIKANETEFLSNALNLVRNAYYKWRNKVQTAHDSRDEELRELVEIEFKKGRGVYGAVRVLKKLQQQVTKHHGDALDDSGGIRNLNKFVLYLDYVW